MLILHDPFFVAFQSLGPLLDLLIPEIAQTDQFLLQFLHFGPAGLLPLLVLLQRLIASLPFLTESFGCVVILQIYLLQFSHQVVQILLSSLLHLVMILQDGGNVEIGTIVAFMDSLEGDFKSVVLLLLKHSQFLLDELTCCLLHLDLLVINGLRLLHFSLADGLGLLLRALLDVEFHPLDVFFGANETIFNGRRMHDVLQEHQQGGHHLSPLSAIHVGGLQQI
mmetsp:Transcript_11822/g.21591  ORF Transcript_11822/g.21591 Transcript_11822/m.21591 type:complete len:223 (-) Transcript_11822:558-1226(-)